MGWWVLAGCFVVVVVGGGVTQTRFTFNFVSIVESSIQLEVVVPVEKM